MKLSDVLDQHPTDRAARRVYGEPYETADGATVIPVAKIRGGKGPAPTRAARTTRARPSASARRR